MSLLEHSQSFGLMSSLVASRHNNPHSCQDPAVSNNFCVINSSHVEFKLTPFFGLQSSNLPVGGSVTSENENTESSTNVASHANALVGK